MQFFAWLFGILVLLLLFVLLMICPGFARRFRSALGQRLATAQYAHRGLHQVQNGVPENSMAAFRRAVETGCGIELDVQRTADGQVVVFHDRSLKRVCGVDKNVDDCTYAELQTYTLSGTTEQIPLFSDVLALVDGQVPLLVELKYHTDRPQLCAQTAELLDKYNGDYMIESFHPEILLWWRKNRPHVLRGFLAQSMAGYTGYPKVLAFLVGNLMLNLVLTPDFIAYSFDDRNGWALQIYRRLYGGRCAYWTLRTPEAVQTALHEHGMPIFEETD